MKIEKIKVVGCDANGVEHCRAKIRAGDGKLHRVLIPSYKLRNPHALAAHVRAATGRNLQVDAGDPDSWEVQLQAALAAGGRGPVPRNEGFRPTLPAAVGGSGFPLSSSVAGTQGQNGSMFSVTDDAVIRTIGLRLIGSLTAWLQTGSANPDQLQDIIDTAAAALAEVD